VYSSRNDEASYKGFVIVMCGYIFVGLGLLK
jgi:hypothetical protein